MRYLRNKPYEGNKNTDFLLTLNMCSFNIRHMVDELNTIF